VGDLEETSRRGREDVTTMKKKGWQVVEHKSGHDERERERESTSEHMYRARIKTDRQENMMLRGVTGGSRSRDGRLLHWQLIESR